jgi:hypothetical protein
MVFTFGMREAHHPSKRDLEPTSRVLICGGNLCRVRGLLIWWLPPTPWAQRARVSFYFLIYLIFSLIFVNKKTQQG